MPEPLKTLLELEIEDMRQLLFRHANQTLSLDPTLSHELWSLIITLDRILRESESGR